MNAGVLRLIQMNPQARTTRDSKNFLVLIVGFSISVGIGLTYRAVYGEIAVVGTMLPSMLAILYSGYVGLTTNILRAMFIWMYFPIVFATAMFGSALGCNDGM